MLKYQTKDEGKRVLRSCSTNGCLVGLLNFFSTWMCSILFWRWEARIRLCCSLWPSHSFRYQTQSP